MADPTADLQQKLVDLQQNLADHKADKDKRDTKKWNSRNQGSSQLTVWQWLTRAHIVSLPHDHEFKTTEDTKILATIQNFRRRQERCRPKQTQPTLLLRRCGCGFVCMRSNKKFILDVGMEREQKQEGICITFHCRMCTCNTIIISHSGGMQEWVIQIPSMFFSIPKFLLLVYAHAHETTPTSVYKLRRAGFGLHLSCQSYRFQVSRNARDSHKLLLR